MVKLWLRAETKKNEQRTALSPELCARLIATGFSITAEKCSQRIFKNEEYATAGCAMVEGGSWVDAPLDFIIIGLKELPEMEFALVHTHIMFAHCYKHQDGWETVLERFARGNGTLLDIEFLMLKGRRVAAFGYYAGFAGCAVAIDAWVHKVLNGAATYPKIEPFDNEDKLIAHTKARLALAAAAGASLPSVMVMGALGRCGTGACDFAVASGIDSYYFANHRSKIVRWDMEQTRNGGPFPEIMQNDIFVNCIYLSQPIPPFVSAAMLNDEKRALSVICDVACDPTNPHNPLPFYSNITTFDEPLLNVPVTKGPELDVIAIDHLPTLLPREASTAFGNDLFESLVALKDRKSSPVWAGADALFIEKCRELAAIFKK